MIQLGSKVNLYRAIIDQAIERVLDRGFFINGPEVKKLELEFSNYINVPFCITVANGTDALELALRTCGIKKGDKVATVSNAGFYTSTALLALKAVPFYLDVDIETQLVAFPEIKRALQSNIKAIVVTHLYGKVVPEIEQIVTLCLKAGITLIEDCAQAHGAILNGKKAGSFGDIGCFSFYPTKNLGAFGDGGAVVCKNHAIAQKLEKLRQYGWGVKYKVEISGGRNSRLDELQAAILNTFLPYLDAWNTRRREIATFYSTSIKHPKVQVPPVFGKENVAHLYVIQSDERDDLRQYLKKQGIATDIHYPIPDYQQSIFKNKFFGFQLPNTEFLAKKILTLPCYPEMNLEDMALIIKAINNWI